MRTLIIGCNGQVGHELCRLFPEFGEVSAIDFPDLDLTNHAQITAVVRDVRPELIINAAAYTAVDSAEDDEARAQQVNGEAPGILAREARALGAAIIHYSTDYVFDGGKSEPWVEDDPPHPLSAYGRTKLAGERAVAGSGARHLILRTSWVYSERSKNFFLTILRLAETRSELRIVADQKGTPTSAHTLARATAACVRAESARCPAGELFRATSGIYHVTGEGSTTWHGFTQAILEECRKFPDLAARLKVENVIPIATEDYPLPAARPRNSVLCNCKLWDTFGVESVPWRDQLRELVASISVHPEGGRGE